MAKPGSNPTWATANPTDATSGQAAIIAPSAGKVASGFLRLEEPPRQDLNWFMNLVGLWVTHLESLTDALEDNVQSVNSSQDIATDLTTSTTLLLDASDARYLDDDAIAGLRIDSILLTAGTHAGVTVTRGTARAGSRDLTVNTDSYGGGNTWSKYIEKAGVSAPYAFGDGEIGWTDAGGPQAGTWYHVFIVYNDTTKLFDIGFDESPIATDLLAVSGIDKIRRIFSLYYIDATSGFRPVIQFGDRFVYSAPGQASRVDGTLLEADSVPKDLDLAPYLPNGVDCMFHFKWNSQISVGIAGVAATFWSAAFPAFTDYAATGVKDMWRRASLATTEDLWTGESDLPISGVAGGELLKMWFTKSTSSSIAISVYPMWYTDLRGKDWGYNTANPTPQRYGF